MPVHVPKRVYTASAIEEWFDRLSADWASLFGDHELSLGQQIYQNGNVTSIELQKGHAIVHGKVDKKELYALVEWEKKGDDNHINVRSSSQNTLHGRALAVAGLYEAEELVADGASPIPLDDAANTEPKKGGIFSDAPKPSLFAPKAVAVDRTALLRRAASGGARVPSPTPSPAPPSRTLLVRFVPLGQGLAFDAYWQDIDGKTTPALKMYNAQAPHITDIERERLIRLTALARKSGFELEGKTHDYVLGDLSKIPEVLKNDVDVWKKYFHVELSPEAAVLCRGVQTVTVEVVAKGVGRELQFDWMFLLGGRELNKTQVKKLLHAGREAVLIEPLGLLQLCPEQADVVADWREAILSDSGALPKYILFSLFRQDALPIRLSKELEEWTRELMTEAEAPHNAPDFLRDYQRKAVGWLGHMLDHDCHPLLADEMGLGKTMQMLSLLQVRLGTAIAQELPSIIVMPASVVPVWQMEIAKRFGQIKVEVLSADNPIRPQGGIVWLASYGQLKRQADSLSAVSYAYAILDEAQMIKNPRTKAAKACYALKANHRLAMTGTPVENRPMDLWSIFRFLMPGLLGGSTRLEALCEEQPTQVMQRLHQQVGPFILRRTKREVAKELPEKIETILTAPLKPLQRQQYARLVEAGVKKLGNDLRKASQSRGLAFFTLLTRLRQASCDAGLLPWVQCPPGDSGKIEVMLEKLEGIITSGSKVVIFSQFVGFLRRIESAIADRFAEVPRYQLTGSTVDRQRPVADFQAQRGSAIMLVSLRAGGTGITLHAADYLFLMDPWWNPAVEDQAIDRVHRIGQQRTVFVYRVVSEGTVEERIQQLKAQKKELFANLIGAIQDNTHFALYFKSMQELIALSPANAEESDE